MKYRYYLIGKVISTLTKKGNKFKAMKIFLNLMSFLKKKKKEKPLKYLIKSIYNVKPTVFYKKKRMGSKVIYLPKLLSQESQIKQGIFWLVHFSNQKEKKKNIFEENFISEVLLSLNKKGRAYKEKRKIYHLLIDSRPYLYLIKYN